ncbi:transmembrane 9 superfamily member 5 [Punica granatum]|uniref:Transmembrane 9 superfamily member n=2 Tax=Punica granatum TaxID=22663 RepID=A0A218WLE0_PUNGR|nr:transmembrane 9 superfamily member 5 [Punica granatum]OWM73657.1 hypothetical protein CDL15_Pgr026756 [Punica granatum]PKI53689.1 hypothetical protein CRG98_025930 [Punica granatum]
MSGKALNRNLIFWLCFLGNPALWHPSTAASPGDRRLYNVGDHVPLFANKVGPLHNPSETYQYYDLPFCRPDPLIPKRESLGEVLSGDRLTNTLYSLKFGEVKTGVTLCKKRLSRDEVAMFRDAVINDFYFQMHYDDLPLWGFIGKIEDSNWALEEMMPRYYLFKHIKFDAFYNGNQIIEIRAFGHPNHVVDITEDDEVDMEFTYSVFWNTTSTRFEDRMNRYLQTSMLPINKQIHWFSLLNSLVVLVLLMGLFALLFMRRLNNDLRMCSGGDEEEDKEAGWKYIRGDVFRLPSNLSLLCATLGSGMQILTMLCFLFILSFLGILYPYNRGALSTALVLAYTFTSVIAGSTAAYFHNQFAETGWERSVLLAGILYPGPVFLIMSIINTISMAYQSTVALPFGSIVVILLLYTLIAVPLLALGGLIGHRFRPEFQAPSPTNKQARGLPLLPWYRKALSDMFIGGLLSFSAVFLELHQVSASLWGFKISALPGTLFITFIILVVLTVILSIGLTFTQLSSEDHRWWWRSVLRGGAMAIYMFGYSIYFYAKSNMSGFMQLSVFLGYNALMSYAFFLMLGTVSFLASFTFIHRIYQAIKSE